MMNAFARYGVVEQASSATTTDYAIEQLKLLGFAVVDGGYSNEDLAAFSSAFDRAQSAMETGFGRDRLVAIDEHNTIRAALAYEPVFLGLAQNPAVLEICRRMIGPYIILNQQNGVRNPANAQRYNQGAYHRDLPYQHFVSSRPIAINALFCIDDFTTENGATWVLPGSHKESPFPSDRIVQSLQIQCTAPAGSFLLLDCMLFHSGGTNNSPRDRRAVNHVYTIPMIKQQVDLRGVLGDDFISDPETRRLLGFDIRVPADLDAYYRSREAKAM